MVGLVTIIDIKIRDISLAIVTRWKGVKNFRRPSDGLLTR
jgi:hypothetical protein